ncbi:MAG TPA: hypothetical protein VGS97_15830 [Actinocrinis sp.]|uniref:hypothetical protein n=1 Tax=Actinocrinis sp. TaxID=1920516 RepID=UPI002DDDB3AC|nr:hypothetical protein [Actinocrinis sp.]HEV2345568.1 hypothetical protein [Actinocrinis sp.]
MSLDQTFERRRRLDAVADTNGWDRHSAGSVASTTASTTAVPVLDALSGLLPDGLRRGEAVSLAGRGQDRSPGYLALALLAGALRAGLWCAAVGVTGLGGLALADLLGRGTERRAGLARLLVAPEPGERWAQVTAVLADGVDLLLVRPPGQVPAQLARRIDARLRQGRTSGGTRHSAALLVLGAWPGAQLELRTARTVWAGLSEAGPAAGTGHLTGGQATVVAAGRATAGRTRTARLWLPTATGTAEPLLSTDDAPSSNLTVSGGAGSANAQQRVTLQPHTRPRSRSKSPDIPPSMTDTTDTTDDAASPASPAPAASPGRQLSIVA